MPERKKNMNTLHQTFAKRKKCIFVDPEKGKDTSLNTLRKCIVECVSYNVATKGEKPITGTEAESIEYDKKYFYQRKDEIMTQIIEALLAHPEWDIDWAYVSDIPNGPKEFISALVIETAEGQLSFHQPRFFAVEEFEVITGKKARIPWNKVVGGSRIVAEKIKQSL